MYCHRLLCSQIKIDCNALDRQEEITTPDEPPSYEAPPDYEEVIKIGMEHEMREPRERHRKHHRRHRDCSRASSNVTVSSTVPIHNCSDRPTTSQAAIANLTIPADNVIPSAIILPEMDGAAVCQELSQRVIKATQNCGK